VRGTTGAAADLPRHLHTQVRWRGLEVAFWALTPLPFLLFPSYLQLASQVAITALFALSLDLLLGYAGIVSLGHAAFFGVGAYAAGLLAKAAWGEPLSGLVVAALAAGLAGFVTSVLVARTRHLALIMVTLGVGLLFHEAANRAHGVTGGADGLQGVRMWPLLGRFRFDLYGYTAYAYALGVLFLLFLVARRLTHSPFGLSLRAIRENPARMPALGASVRAQVRRVYTISAVLAGVPGALLAQTTETVSLATLDFQRSAEVLVVLILGGAGRLYGGLVGAVVFLVARDRFSGLNPQYWYFWMGALLVLVVIFLPNGILGGLARVGAAARPDGAPGDGPSRPPGWRGGGLFDRVVRRPLRRRAGYGDGVVLDDVSLEVPEGGSLAVLGRNGAGKSTLLLTIMGYTEIHRGRIAWRGREVTTMPPHHRARAGLGWVPQEREIFPSLTVQQNLTVPARPGRWNAAAVYALFPRLAERRETRGHHLSGGEQQMLAIARALMTNPALLLLGEPLEGLAPLVVDELVRAIRRLAADRATAVVLVEQHAELALALTDEAVVLERGRVAHRAPSSQLLRDPATLDRLIGLRLAGDPADAGGPPAGGR
jgi:branched-chain amino acid transport system permease protein